MPRKKFLNFITNKITWLQRCQIIRVAKLTKISRMCHIQVQQNQFKCFNIDKKRHLQTIFATNFYVSIYDRVITLIRFLYCNGIYCPILQFLQYRSFCDGQGFFLIPMGCQIFSVAKCCHDNIIWHFVLSPKEYSRRCILVASVMTAKI